MSTNIQPRLTTDLARFLRHINQGYVTEDDGVTWLKTTTSATRVDVSHLAQVVVMAGFADRPHAGKWSLNGTGVQALVGQGARA